MPELPPMDIPEAPRIPAPPTMPMPQMLPSQPQLKEVREIPAQKPVPQITPRAEMVMLPKREEIMEIKQSFPTVPSSIPDKIPPLEGITAPEFRPKNGEKEPVSDFRTEKAEPLRVERPAKTISKGPLFIKVTMFKDAIVTMDSVLNTFKKEDDIFFRVTDVKNTQDKKYEEFRLALEDMQRKLIFVDKNLFESR